MKRQKNILTNFWENVEKEIAKYFSFFFTVVYWESINKMTDNYEWNNKIMSITLNISWSAWSDLIIPSSLAIRASAIAHETDW